MPTSSISVKFKNDSQIQLSGNGRAKIKLKLEWDDDPDNAGDAIDDVKWNGINMDSPGSDGSSTSTSDVAIRGTYNLNYTGQPYGKRKVSDSKICFLDNDGDDCNAYLTIVGDPIQQTYTNIAASLTVNATAGDIVIGEGENVSVVWAVTGTTMNSKGVSSEGDYAKVKERVPGGSYTDFSEKPSGSKTFKNLELGTYRYRLKTYQYITDTEIEYTRKVTVVEQPEATLSITPAGVIQNNTCGVGATANGVTLSWTSSGNKNGFEFIGDFGGATAPTITSNSEKDEGSFTFYPTEAGSNKTIKLKVTSEIETSPGAFLSYTTPVVSYDVYDHCPSDFEWDDSTDNTPLNNSNRESNTISIKDFGPTSAADNSLSISSNTSGLQVSINGGPWQDV